MVLKTVHGCDICKKIYTKKDSQFFARFSMDTFGYSNCLCNDCFSEYLNKYVYFFKNNSYTEYLISFEKKLENYSDGYTYSNKKKLKKLNKSFEWKIDFILGFVEFFDPDLEE